VPLIGPTDALVRVKTASICGTDLHIYGWDRWSQGRIKPPVTLGHEFCGTVERVGDEVRAVKPGISSARKCTSIAGIATSAGWAKRTFARTCASSGSIRTGLRGVREDSGAEYLEAGSGDS